MNLNRLIITSLLFAPIAASAAPSPVINPKQMQPPAIERLERLQTHVETVDEMFRRFKRSAQPEVRPAAPDPNRLPAADAGTAAMLPRTLRPAATIAIRSAA
jgi:hypothetical protein